MIFFDLTENLMIGRNYFFYQEGCRTEKSFTVILPARPQYPPRHLVIILVGTIMELWSFSQDIRSNTKMLARAPYLIRTSRKTCFSYFQHVIPQSQNSQKYSTFPTLEKGRRRGRSRGTGHDNQQSKLWW